MKTEYTPVQGRGFVRPGETEKQQNRGFSGIKKAATKCSRLSEQLTCCEKIGSVQGNYISYVTKRHNDRITGKTKATVKRSPIGTREIKRVTNNATFVAGGQCDQSGLIRCHARNERSFLGYTMRYFSRANAHGANLSDSCPCAIFLRRFFRTGDGVLVDSLLVIVLSCKETRRSSSHHGADSFYLLGSMSRCCNSLRIIRFIQAARESSPSCCCAFSIFSRKSGSKRNWNGGLPRLSFLCVDTLITPHVMYLCVMTHYTQSTQKAKPRECRYHWQGF
ncbi:hypothetical protein [Escherichia coli]|uniref:hypothetical protein n=1 Tax=Escherichia coli TaxID=562 RepID=UPI000CFA95D1|nr:hypothetical protein [Escherichia coli]